MKTPLSAASWIWSPASPGADAYLCFRSTWVQRENGEDGWVDLAVDSDFVLYLNGNELGRGQFSDLPRSKTWSRFPVNRHQLQDGKNVLAVLVFHRGEAFSDYAAGPGGLLLALQEGGRRRVSDETWRCTLHPAFSSGNRRRMTAQTGFTFQYDARREEDWLELGFDDSDWSRAIITQQLWQGGPQWMQVLPRPLSPLCLGRMPNVRIVMQGSYFSMPTPGVRHVAESMSARALRAERPGAVFEMAELSAPPACSGPLPNAGHWISPGAREPLLVGRPEAAAHGRYLVIDLGAQSVGLLELEVEAAAGTMIEVAHGEHLEDGRVRAVIDDRFFADRYICGEGRRRFQMPFRRLAARYLEVHVSDAVTIYGFGLRPVSYPSERKGVFEVADPMALRLHEMALRTLELCRHEHYEDCPWREQALYGFDGRLQALYGYLAFGDYHFAEVSLSLLGGTYEPDGFLALTAPGKRGRVIPIFSFHWVSALAEHWLYSGKPTLYERFTSVAEAILNKALERWDADTGLYLPPGTAYWDFYEWSPGLSGETDMPVFHAMYQLVLHEAGRSWIWMLRQAGRVSESYIWEERLARLRIAFDRNFWDETAGLYSSFAPGASVFHEAVQVMALNEGLGSLSSRHRIMERVQRGAMVPAMLSGKYFLLKSVCTRFPERLPWLERHLQAIWQKMAWSGATCLWETVNGADDFHFAGSLCHGWSSLPLYYHQAVVLGVTPLEPGFRSFSLEVFPERFSQARGTVPTPYGMIEVDWRLEGGGLHLCVTGPQECSAVLRSVPGYPVTIASYNDQLLEEEPSYIGELLARSIL